MRDSAWHTVDSDRWRDDDEVRPRRRRLNYGKLAVAVLVVAALGLALWSALAVIGALVLGIVTVVFSIVGALLSVVWALVSVVVKLLLTPVIGLIVVAGALWWLFSRADRRRSR